MESFKRYPKSAKTGNFGKKILPLKNVLRKRGALKWVSMLCDNYLGFGVADALALLSKRDSLKKNFEQHRHTSNRNLTVILCVCIFCFSFWKQLHTCRVFCCEIGKFFDVSELKQEMHCNNSLKCCRKKRKDHGLSVEHINCQFILWSRWYIFLAQKL
eukprot:TRINITY_DN6409_c3_g1_i1.p1 TRINITY_DN6409_c3_g1~~TRINITY_DN6409_c3_g1_i1.p1  ORF type:complete len:158 (-),score=6.64 TRINITY_DN6409_c3_g1_i1:23-496(-)